MKRVSWALTATFLCEVVAAAPSSARDQVQTIVEGRGDARSRGEALAALIELGPAFVPGACELLLTDAATDEEAAPEDIEVAPLTAWDPEALLFEALAQFPAREVVQGVEGAIRSDSELTLRLTAARLFSMFGDAESVAPLLRLFEGDPGSTLARPSVRGRIESSLSGLLARDDAGWGVLERLGPFVTPELEQLRLSGFAERGDEGSVEVLMSALGHSDALDAYVLGAFAALQPRAAVATRDWILGAVAPLVGAGTEPEVRRAALYLLGEHAAFEQVDELLEALEDPDERMRAVGRRALVRLTAVDRAEDPDLWRAFCKRERAWYAERFELLVGQLDDPELANARQAMAELIAHAAFRRPITAALGTLALDADEERGRLAVGYLAALDEPSGVEYLIRIARRADSVGEGALAALAERTGQGFESHEEWLSWWEGEAR